MTTKRQKPNGRFVVKNQRITSLVDLHVRCLEKVTNIGGIWWWFRYIQTMIKSKKSSKETNPRIWVICHPLKIKIYILYIYILYYIEKIYNIISPSTNPVRTQHRGPATFALMKFLLSKFFDHETPIGSQLDSWPQGQKSWLVNQPPPNVPPPEIRPY